MSCTAEDATTWAVIGSLLTLLLLYVGHALHQLGRRHGRTLRDWSMRTADAAQIERDAARAQRLASRTMATTEATPGTDAPTPRPTVVQLQPRSVITQHDRAAITRRAKCTASSDFHHEHRRSANPYPRHSPAYALYAVEYAAAWQALAEPDQAATQRPVHGGFPGEPVR